MENRILKEYEEYKNIQYNAFQKYKNNGPVDRQIFDLDYLTYITNKKLINYKDRCEKEYDVLAY